MSENFVLSRVETKFSLPYLTQSTHCMDHAHALGRYSRKRESFHHTPVQQVFFNYLRYILRQFGMRFGWIVVAVRVPVLRSSLPHTPSPKNIRVRATDWRSALASA
jgi:hypothetical protein